MSRPGSGSRFRSGWICVYWLGVREEMNLVEGVGRNS